MYTVYSNTCNGPRSERAIGVQGANIILQTVLLVSKNASIKKDQRKKKFGGSSGIQTHAEESERAIGVQGATIVLQTMLLVSKNASIKKN